MNNISKLARICSSVKFGKNNIIGDNVKIYDKVIIGNNNKILDNSIIYPNTIIGNNNVFLDSNIVGEHPVSSQETFTEKKFNGLEIGNNNFFHVKNLIFNGCDKKTIIGNNNKLLAENHIGHDTHITNNVILYPRCITGGHSILLPYSTMGFYSTIQQRMVLGSYSMIGAGNNVSHNVFPFYIYVNNKYLRYNSYIIPKNINIENYDLSDIISYIKEKSFDTVILKKIKEFPIEINQPILDFYNKLTKYKI